MQPEDDQNSSKRLISKGLSPDVVANMSADHRKALADRLSITPAKDRGIFVWLLLCFAIIAVTALISIVF